jgi:predicted nuclease of restriction endonuclease-like RecB superfamily
MKVETAYLTNSNERQAEYSQHIRTPLALVSRLQYGNLLLKTFPMLLKCETWIET